MQAAFSGIHAPNLLAHIGCSFHFQHVVDPLYGCPITPLASSPSTKIDL
jgi:hypothetical protein